MKTILIGTIAFLIWSGISTYYYVCQIQGLCTNDEVVAEVAPEPEVIEPEVRSEIFEEEPKIESPGGFTLHHLYNHQDVINDERLTPYLDQLKIFLNQQTNATVNITGFADEIGPEQYNYELGLNRAKYVEALLVNSGIPAEKLSVDSKGEKEPIATNANREGRAKNRRTEIKLN